MDDTTAPEGKPGLPQMSFWQRVAWLKPYFGQKLGLWVLVACSTVTGALTEPFIPALLKPLLDKGFQAGELDIWKIPAALLLLFGVRGLAGYITQLGLSRLVNHGLSNMRQAMFTKLQTADLELFSKESASAISNTLVYEVQTGANMLIGAVISLVRNFLTLLALAAYLIYLNWKLTLIVVAVFPAVAWVMRLLTKRVHQLTKSSQDATDALAYVVEENVLAHKDIRLFGAQQSQTERFANLSERLNRLGMKSTIAGAAMTPLTQMLAAVALSAVISVALMQSASSGTSVGGFVAFVTAMLMIVAPLRQLSEVSSPITRGMAALERGLALIHHTASETQGKHTMPRARGHLEFCDIGVRYKPEGPWALQHINLTIKPGQTVAFVGSSGSGKSTLVNMLPRFVQATYGHINLDGVALPDWDLNSLRQQFATVSQHVVLLNDTLAANVSLGAQPDLDRVKQALQTAHLMELVHTLPQGLNTILGHNALELSGGQRQRLAIARAVYKNAPILILDEATSALDNESEKLVQQALEALMRNRTTLVIAHRLSTVMHADRIVVMSDGRIVEEGSHASLLAANGHYARLYQTGL